MEEVMEMQSKMTFNFEKIRQESEWQWRSFLLCKKISLRESTPCSVTFDGGMDSKECFLLLPFYPILILPMFLSLSV